MENTSPKNNGWWAADGAASDIYEIAKYYDEFVVITNSNLTECIKTKLPDVVVLSKPDIYDTNGKLRVLLKNNDFKENHQFASFVIYKK